jgi:hypothetical protein
MLQRVNVFPTAVHVGIGVEESCWSIPLLEQEESGFLPRYR